MLSLEQWLLIGGVVAVGGLLRGLAGFGSALVLAPGIALMLGARDGVVITVILNALTLVQLVIPAAALTRRRIVVPMVIAAVIATPFGTHLLASVDAHALRRGIGAFSIVAAACMLVKIRVPSTTRVSASLAAGALSGFATGVSGIGGPPAVLYLMSDRGTPGAVLRADFIVFLTFGQLAAVPPLFVLHVVTWPLVIIALELVPLYVVATAVGAYGFRRFGNRSFTTLGAAIVVALGIVALI